jgi:hypothetical protein
MAVNVMAALGDPAALLIAATGLELPLPLRERTYKSRLIKGFVPPLE